jgi:hypothetical protein
MQLKMLQKWCAVAGIVGVSGALVFTGRHSIHKADCEFWNLPRWNAEIQEMNESNEQMSMESTVVTERIAAKESMIHDLVEGHRNLADVMNRFRELNADNPEVQFLLECRYPDQDQDERLYHNVLDFVYVEAKDRSDYPAVQARLAYEWTELRARRTHLN